MPKTPEISKQFHFHGSYNCPVCRHGEIEAMLLMEAFACNFCHHIFTANVEKQILKIADSQLPLTWRWQGQTWKRIEKEGTELGWGYIVIAIAFLVIPTSLIGLAAYLFPPLPDSSLSWFPLWWTALTFFSHLVCLIWLILEYYQIPINLYFRAFREEILRSR